jgi:hypothetical protein
LSIGSGVKSIDYGTFSADWQLKSLTCHAVTPPAFGVNDNWSNFSTNVYEQATLYVPEESISAYGKADTWKSFLTIKAIPNHIPGDVNGDNDVTIADVNVVINAILSNTYDEMYDVNGDKDVNIADVNAIINIILQ